MNLTAQLDINGTFNTELKPSFDKLPVEKCREMFDNLENALLKLPQISDEEYQLKESYSGGIYCRQFTIPAGALVTGRIYKRDHIEIMISGNVLIVSADGPKKHYIGYNMIEAKAGKRQAGLAVEDTIWMTVYKVPESVPSDKRLDYATVGSFDEYNKFINQEDYDNLLLELGMNQDQMDEIVKTDDVVNMDPTYNHIYVEDSDVQGKGLFTKEPIDQGEIICPSRIGNKRTIAGRYSNHSLSANSSPYTENGKFYFIAKKDIKAGEEITSNYREILKFRSIKGDLS